MLALTALLLPAGPLQAQSTDGPEDPPFLPTEVLLLGTFHFADQGLDDSAPSRQVELASEADRREIEEVLSRLAAWKPTRVAVEWPAGEQAALDSAYAEFRAGTAPATANERSTIGFELARQLGHPRVFSIDAPAAWYDSTINTEKLIAVAERHGQRDLMARAQRWFDYMDRAGGREAGAPRTLLQTLVDINRPESLRRLHSRYLVGQIEVGGEGDYTGADMRSAWFNRNIRIFSNLLRMRGGPGGRVLVLIGAGHVPILDHLARNSPEVRLADVAAVLSRE
jgi:hypothetical protein